MFMNNKNGMMAEWDSERWAAVIVVSALVLLIMLRFGFRGVNVLGVRASIT